MATSVLSNWKEQIEKIMEANWQEQLAFLQEIGKMPSVLGNEQEVQQYVAQYLRQNLALEVDSFIPDRNKLAHLPGYSPVDWNYEDRPVVAGVYKNTGKKIGKSLILQGHMDVVPEGSLELWEHDPWAASIIGDRMYGRGIQDMKSGNTAMIFALKAIIDANIRLGADVTIQSVIEEECTGNGALALLDKGYTAEGALIPEPFNEEALIAQVGVFWTKIKITGRGGHTQDSNPSVNAIEKMSELIPLIKKYEKEINSARKHAVYQSHDHPLKVNIGKIQGGDWTSSVAEQCELEVRIGLYPDTDPQEAKDQFRSWLKDQWQKHEWFKHQPPEVLFHGFHAEGTTIHPKHELLTTLGKAHQAVNGEQLKHTVVSCTTDMRLFTEHYSIPTTCYGPKGNNMHSANEWVDLNSLKRVTKTIALFILDWCGVQSEKGK